MIVDFKHVRLNVRDKRTTLFGGLFIVIGLVVALVPFYMVAKLVTLDASLFQLIKEYAEWVAGTFIVLGLTLIGFIRTGNANKDENADEP